MSLSLIQKAHQMGLDHPEKVELYVSPYPGGVRVIGYRVLVCRSDIEIDWTLACQRVREWERDNFIRNVIRIWTAGI